MQTQIFKQTCEFSNFIEAAKFLKSIYDTKKEQCDVAIIKCVFQGKIIKKVKCTIDFKFESKLSELDRQNLRAASAIFGKKASIYIQGKGSEILLTSKTVDSNEMKVFTDEMDKLGAPAASRVSNLVGNINFLNPSNLLSAGALKQPQNPEKLQ